MNQPIPVILITGFLGAGKTTLLQQLLKQKDFPENWGLLVNDFGEINWDSQMLRNEGPAQVEREEITQGCLCCSARDSFRNALDELSRRPGLQGILVEASGAASPRDLPGLSESRGGLNATSQAEGSPQAKGWPQASAPPRWYWKALVNVVALDQLEEQKEALVKAGPLRRILSSDPRRPWQELLLEQMEGASLQVLTKGESLLAESRESLVAFLREYNPQAELYRTPSPALAPSENSASSLGQPSQALGLPEIHDWSSFWSALPLGGLSAAKNAAGPKISSLGRSPLGQGSPGRKPLGSTSSLLMTKPTQNAQRFPLVSWRFWSDRPFDEGRLMALLRQGWPGVFRIKGLYWLSREPQRWGYLSLAGRILRADLMTEWSQSSWGHPRQDLVVLGDGFDPQELGQALESCLVD